MVKIPIKSMKHFRSHGDFCTLSRLDVYAPEQVKNYPIWEAGYEEGARARTLIDTSRYNINLSLVLLLAILSATIAILFK